MNKIRLARRWSSILFSSLSLGISYLLGKTIPSMGLTKGYEFWIELFSVGLGSFAGGAIGFWIAKSLISWDRLRQWLVAPFNIEGYWHIITEPTIIDDEAPENDTHCLINRGIMIITYDSGSERFHVVVARYDELGKKFITTSKYCHMENENGKVIYLNYFDIKHGPRDEFAICEGTFERIDTSKRDVDYFTSLIYAEKSISRRQFAYRIKEELVKKYKSDKSDWERLVLLDLARQELEKDG